MNSLEHPIEIYLDSNIYISIAKREYGSDYVAAKITNLKKLGVLFPHAPPHAEEVSARIKSNREIDVAVRFANLIMRFNSGVGYLPGFPNEQETVSLLNVLRGAVSQEPGLAAAIEIHEKNLDLICSGKITEEQFRTRLISESFYDCLRRVDNLLDLTDIARRNDIYFMGRRSENSLASNFESIGQQIGAVETFDRIHKEYNLGPRRLSNIDPDDIFYDNYFVRFVKEEFCRNGVNFDELPSAEELNGSHHQKESIITLMLNSMEKAGYSQEQKNHEAALTGRMHDVSHAIYASRANFFVTSDVRFSNKVKATYRKLGLSTRVVSADEFLSIDLSGGRSILLQH